MIVRHGDPLRLVEDVFTALLEQMRRPVSVPHAGEHCTACAVNELREQLKISLALLIGGGGF